MNYFAETGLRTDSGRYTTLLEEYLPSLDDLAGKLNDNNRFLVDAESLEKHSEIVRESYNKTNPIFWSANEMLIPKGGGRRVAIIENNPYAGESPTFLPPALRQEMADDYVKNLERNNPEIKSVAVGYLPWEKFPHDIANSLEKRGIKTIKIMEKSAGSSEFEAEPPNMEDVDEIVQFAIGLPRKWNITSGGPTNSVFSQIMMDAKVSQLAAFNYFEKKGVRTFTPAAYLASDGSYLEKALDIFRDYGIQKIVTKGVDDISFGGRNTKFWGLNGTSVDEIPAYYKSLKSPIILQEFVEFVPVSEESESKRQIQVRKKGYRFLKQKIIEGEKIKKEYAYNIRLFTLPDKGGFRTYGGFIKLGRSPIAILNGGIREGSGSTENKYNTSANGGAVITYDNDAVPLNIHYKEEKDMRTFTLPITKGNINQLSAISQGHTAMLAKFYDIVGPQNIYSGLKKICGLPNTVGFE